MSNLGVANRLTIISLLRKPCYNFQNLSFLLLFRFQRITVHCDLLGGLTTYL